MPFNSEISLKLKKEKLWANLNKYPSLAIAFSGGVDSTLLLASAAAVLGERVVAMTARSAIHSTAASENAYRMVRHIGVRHLFFDTDELSAAQFVTNDAQRCYHCKKILFESMRRLAAKEQIADLAHGANVDDLADFRPGFVAAQELGVDAPLITAGLTKGDVRRLARELGLPNWDRPPMACLATRIPYGVAIRPALLRQIEHAEGAMAKLGFDSCRVRHHGSLVRLEIDSAEIPGFLVEATRQKVVAALRALGFTYVALDLEGYQSGKMNRELSL